jgi:hypothetical protein
MGLIERDNAIGIEPREPCGLSSQRKAHSSIQLGFRRIFVFKIAPVAMGCRLWLPSQATGERAPTAIAIPEPPRVPVT